MDKQVTRKLVAVVFSDIVGYTRLMGEDEERAYTLLKENNEIHLSIIEKYNGELIKELGDGILSIYPSVEAALLASIEIQQYYYKRNTIEIRIGIHHGDIIYDNHDVFGDAVNIASRIQAIGVGGCILISKKVKELISDKISIAKIPMGKYELKNVFRPIEIFAIGANGVKVPRKIDIEKNQAALQKKWVTGVSIFTAILVIVLAYFALTPLFQPTSPESKSVAVLPLKNLNFDAQKDFFSDGLSEDIITQLTKINSIQVISKSSIDKLRNKTLTYAQIAEELGVSAILDGSVQWSGDELRIRVQLIDTKTNENMWSETFDPELEDVFAVQSEIAQMIAVQLEGSLTETEITQLEKKPTTDFEAYESYLKGRQKYNYYQFDSVKLAIQDFKNAISIDPNYALAYTGLADAYAQMYGTFGEGDAYMDSSLNASQKAIDLDPELPGGYLSKGVIYYYQNRYDLALPQIQKAYDLNPNHSRAVGNLATVYMITGQLDKALPLQKRASGLNPNSYIPFQIVGWIYRILGDQKEAQIWLDKSLSIQEVSETYEQLAYSFLIEDETSRAMELIPKILSLGQTYSNYEIAGKIAFFAQDFAKAESHLKRSIELRETNSLDEYFSAPIYLAYILNKNGQADQIIEVLGNSLELRIEELENSSQEDELALMVSAIYLLKNDESASLEYLKKAKELHWVDVFEVQNNALFQNLKSNKEYQELLKEIESLLQEMKKNI